MKIVFVIIAGFALANAGVRELSPYEEDKALQLWVEYCAGGAEGRSVGNTQVYCKISRDNPTINEIRHIKLEGNNEVRNQIVFVKPPSYNYNHQVNIEGGPGGHHSSTIYVLPQKNTHQVQHTYTPGPGVVANKPTVYFLKGDQGSSNQGTTTTSANQGGYPSQGGY